MIELEEQVNQLINQILLKAENQYELTLVSAEVRLS